MEQDKVIPLDTQRRLVAYQTAKSWEEVPHVAYLYEPDATELYQAYLRRREELSGQGLRLTLNTLLLKAVAEGLKAADAGGLSGKQGVEQLDQCGDDDGGAPVLRQQLVFVQPVLPGPGAHQVGVVLQNQAVLPDRLPEHRGVLFQNAQQGKDEENPPLPVPRGVGQGEAERAERLAAAGGHVQPVDAARPLPGVPALARDLLARALDGGVGGEGAQPLLQAHQQPPPEGAEVLRPLRERGAVQIRRGVLPVPVDHGGQKQAGQQAEMEEDLLAAAVGLAVCPLKEGGQLRQRRLKQPIQLLLGRALEEELLHRLAVGRVLPRQPVVKAGAVLGVHAVKQPVVRPGGAGEHLSSHVGVVGELPWVVVPLQQIADRGVGMDDGAPAPGPPFQIVLECGRIFSEVMQQSGKIGGIAQRNAAQASGGQLRGVSTVLLYCLDGDRAVRLRAQVCGIDHRHSTFLKNRLRKEAKLDKMKGSDGTYRLWIER